jgi:aminoglycoside phosphotransferase
MNTIVSFLAKHWQRLPLGEVGASPRLSSMVITPRFRASAHVIFFILPPGGTAPCFVVKVPRLPGDNSRLDREVANLRFVHTARAGGFDSIPRVIVYEDHEDCRLLIETALAGQTMSPALVRRQPDLCLDTVRTWLVDLHVATATYNADATDWNRRLLEDPLERFARVFPLCAEERRLLSQTRAHTAALRHAKVPLVCEHGDLSAPNILLHRNDRLGVVDWELAEAQGLPAVDLFFFLTYVAFAQRHARKLRHHLTAFHRAFFGPTAWARPHIVHYAAQLQLSPEVLRRLFVLCWSRYVTNLVMRLHDLHGTGEKLGQETAAWLRMNRYYALWRHTIEHVHELHWDK